MTDERNKPSNRQTESPLNKSIKIESDRSIRIDSGRSVVGDKLPQNSQRVTDWVKPEKPSKK